MRKELNLTTGESLELPDFPPSPEAPPNFAAQQAIEKARWMAIREQYAGRLASIASRLYASDLLGSTSADAVATSLLGLFTDPAVMAATDIVGYKNALNARYANAFSLATPSAAAEATGTL